MNLMRSVETIQHDPIAGVPGARKIFHLCPGAGVPFGCRCNVLFAKLNANCSRPHCGDEFQVGKAVEHVPVVHVIVRMEQEAPSICLICDLGSPIVEVPRNDHRCEARFQRGHPDG